MKTQLHTSMQARRGGPSRTPAWCPWVCLLATLRSQRPGLAFILVTLEPVGLSWILYTHVIVSHQWSFGKYWFTGLCKCEHSSLHMGEILLADVTGTSSGKSPCRTARRGLEVGVRAESHCGGHAPRLQAPSPSSARAPPESRGACLLTGAPLCPRHLGAPAPRSDPSGPCVGPGSAGPSQNVPVRTGAAAVLLLQVTALLSLRLHLHPWWVWTASPPCITRVSPLSLERGRSALLCSKAHQPCRDLRLSFGSHPRGPRSALRSPGLLTVRRSPPPSGACGMFTAQSSTPSLGPSVSVGRVFFLLWFIFSCCFAGLVIMYWILDTADVIGCQATLSLCVCVCVPV